MTVQNATNIANLRTMSGSTSPCVYVEGYSNAGDGGGGFFIYNASDTTSPDNGATIIVSTSGSRYDRVWGSPFNVLWAGADPSGTTASDTAFATAASLFPVLYMPKGTYKLLNGFSCSIGSGLASFTLTGDGPEQTKLYFPSNAGLSVNYNSGTTYNVAYIRDFSITAGVAGGGTGLLLHYTGSGLPNGITEISNIRIRGNDGIGVYWWGTGIEVQGGVSSVNFDSVAVTGPSLLPQSSGDGINLQGGTQGGIVFNLRGCILDNLQNGLVYGAHIQGVTVTTTQFTHCYTGIVCFSNTPNSPIPLDELIVIGCQFATYAQNITFLTQIGNVIISSNVLTFDSSPTGTTLVSGIFSAFTFTGNSLIGSSSANNVGLEVTSGATGMISGNSFAILQTGVLLDSGSTYFNVQSNSYNDVVNPAINNGMYNKVGGGSP